MGRIFLFWSVILIVLIAGITGIIYGRALLKTEEEETKEILEELSATTVPKVDTVPAIPSGMETGEMSEEVELTEPASPSGIKTEKMQEAIEPPKPVLPLEEQQPLPAVPR